MDYRIIEAASAPELQNGVDELLAIGYKPLGGVSVAVCWFSTRETYFDGQPTTQGEMELTYTQAMIRERGSE